MIHDEQIREIVAKVILRLARRRVESASRMTPQAQDLARRYGVVLNSR